MMLSLDTAYRSFGGEVEASSTPTICRLSDSRRHQLWAIARAGAVSFGHSPFQDRLRLALKQNLVGSADCEPTFGLVPGRPRHVYPQGRPQLAPRAGAVFSRREWEVGAGALRGGWWSIRLSQRRLAQPFGP